MRYATEKEKSAFLERLEKECGYRWNAEKKCLEDIYVLKFGNIVRLNCSCPSSKRDYIICIMPNKPVPYNYEKDYFDIANIDKGINLNFDCAFNKGDKIIPASTAEKQELFDKLAKVGKRWNPVTKELENIRWRADKNGMYYYLIVGNNIIVKTCIDIRISCDNIRYKNSNYFRTPEASQKVADQIKEIFKNSKEE